MDIFDVFLRVIVAFAVWGVVSFLFRWIIDNFDSGQGVGAARSPEGEDSAP